MGLEEFFKGEWENPPAVPDEEKGLAYALSYISEHPPEKYDESKLDRMHLDLIARGDSISESELRDYFMEWESYAQSGMYYSTGEEQMRFYRRYKLVADIIDKMPEETPAEFLQKALKVKQRKTEDS